MVEFAFQKHSSSSSPAHDLLEMGEVVAIVDDSPEIVLLLTHYLESQGFGVVSAGSAKEFQQLLASEPVALLLLDIGLPDRDGNILLKDIVPSHPDLGIIMVTGTTDIEVALDCLRRGADDYLTKPVILEQFNYTVQNTLKKRRLAIDSRRYQNDLQKTNARMRFLHHLNLKMNTAYLNTVELRGILHAILVGITSADGLQFNRAFLALYNEEHTFLEGIMGIGPSSKEKAGHLWASIKAEGLHLDDILESIQSNDISEDFSVNQTIKALKVPAGDRNHVLIHSCREKLSIRVNEGRADDFSVPNELLSTLGELSFAVVPLYSPGKPLGVIIVDNFVTNAEITEQDIQGLEILASQASIAIEHSHLYSAMASKITELELITQELDKSKDLLINSEREAAIGHMSSQLLHSIRNPLTSIGSTSRLLAKKTKDKYLVSFLEVISRETDKIENTLEDLFTYVETDEVTLTLQPIFKVLRKSVMLFYAAMKRQSITYNLHLASPGPFIAIDERKIRQVFLHLIRNSVEAMPKGGTLHIQAQEDHGSVTISVTDSGPGIPADALPHVQAPFFTTKTYGNGMGLAIAAQIIEAHHGNFELATNPKGGNIATIILPT